MNQLFNNEGFLTPEKRCSKGPKMYRFSYPKQVKVLNENSHKIKAERVDFTSSECLYFGPSFHKPKFLNFFTSSYTKFIPGQDVLKLSNSIDSAIKVIKNCKNRRYEAKINEIQNTQNQTDLAVKTIAKASSEFQRLSEELSYLKTKLKDRMTISELD